MASTRRLLERVPTDKGTWKPHEKSFALGHLAQLVAAMPGWIATTLRQPEIDLARFGGYSFEPTKVLVETFDANVRAAREALADVTGAALEEPWSLRQGDRVLFTTPRGETVRSHLNHLIHHRGQLTVYLPRRRAVAVRLRTHRRRALVIRWLVGRRTQLRRAIPS
jgi:uncharacterized damage-inducible protein DinB